MAAATHGFLAEKLRLIGCQLNHDGIPHELREKLHNHLNRLWRASPRTRHCVAPTPVQITRERMAWLRKELYMVSPKTDGTRVLILFAALPHPIIVVYTRKREFVQVRGRAPSEYFRQSGTLLDGELLDDGRILCFDVVVSKGCSMMERNYVERMMEVSSIVRERTLDVPGLELRAKTVYALQDIEHMLRDMEKDNTVPNDGILMTPVNCRITMGSNEMMFKYKEQPTVDLLYETQDGRVSLRWGTKHGTAPVERPGKLGLVLQQSSLPACHTAREGVQEFTVCFSSDRASLTLKWVRSRVGDKSHPNFYHTVNAVFAEVQEGITLTELATFACGVDPNDLPGPMPSQHVRQPHTVRLTTSTQPPKPSEADKPNKVRKNTKVGNASRRKTAVSRSLASCERPIPVSKLPMTAARIQNTAEDTSSAAHNTKKTTKVPQGTSLILTADMIKKLTCNNTFAPYIPSNPHPELLADRKPPSKRAQRRRMPPICELLALELGGHRKPPHT